MRVVSIVGARPQFVKLAPVAAALVAAGVDHRIIHTGQHYDVAMSDAFFDDLGIPAPDLHLGVGSGSHGVQTGQILIALDPALESLSPDWVLVYGDTNSTLAAAVSAVKMHLPLAHLESGLRSRNRRMPEEHNRVLTDHAADVCLAPTQVAMDNLAAEGLAERAVLVGDVMVDVCLATRDQVAGRALADGIPDGDFVLATIHRADNTDDPQRLRSIVDALSKVPVPVVLPVHPRLRDRASAFGIDLATAGIRTTAPLPYPDMVAAVVASRGVVTDSGGLQKEAFLLRRPCTTVRTETEWTETVDLGWNILDPGCARLAKVAARPAPVEDPGSPYGDGSAAAAVAAVLVGRESQPGAVR